MSAWFSLLVAELVRLSREPLLRLAALVLCLGATVALLDGHARAASERSLAMRIAADDTADRSQLHEALLAEPRAVPRWADPRAPGVVGARLAARHVQLPQLPLAHLAVGQREITPSAVKISLSTEPLEERIDTLEDPRSMALGPFDLSFVWVFLLPLLVLASSYDLISSERELGTLGLLAAEPVPLWRLLLAKLAARLLVCFGLIAAIAAVAALVGWLGGGGFDGLGLVMMIALCSLYATFWFALMLAVQQLRRSSAANAMIGVSAWVALVIVTPTACNVALDLVYPIPSRVELLEARRAAQREASERAAVRLDAYYEDHPSQAAGAAQDRYWPMSVLKAQHVRAAVAPVEARHEAQLEQQNRHAAWLQWLTPAALLRSALEELAGTGGARQRRFEAQVRAYHGVYRQHFEAQIMAGARFSAADLPQIPAFTFEEEPRAAGVSRAAELALVMVLPTLLCLWLGLRGLRRVDLEARA